MRKQFLLIIVTVAALFGSASAQYSATPYWYKLLKKTGIFKDAVYTDATKKITFVDSTALSGVANDSTISGTGTAASPLSVVRALPPFVVADSLKHVRINAAGTGVEYAAPSTVKQVIFGHSGQLAQGSTKYINLDAHVGWQGGTVDPTDTSQQVDNEATFFPIAGNITLVTFQPIDPPAAGQTSTISIMINGAETALFTITDADLIKSSGAISIAIPANALVVFKIVNSATSTGMEFTFATVFEPAN